MNEEDTIIYWLGQRDMIANIFMWLRDKDVDEKKVIVHLAALYNSHFDGKNEPNPHVEAYLKSAKRNLRVSYQAPWFRSFMALTSRWLMTPTSNKTTKELTEELKKK